jgi:dienelactone hydrolase
LFLGSAEFRQLDLSKFDFMKFHPFSLVFYFSLFIAFNSCTNTTSNDTAQTQPKDTIQSKPSIKTSEVLYTSNGKQSNGYIAYDENKKGKLPIIVVIPEWWGLVDYIKSRVRQLAGLGYFAIGADLFGGGKTASNPQDAMTLTQPYYTNPELTKPAVEAAIAKAATFSQADATRVGAIGYCFGGFVVLNAAKLGTPLKGVVSFHGGLGGVQPKKGLVQGDILICQGGADPFVPEADQNAFKKSMDSVGAHYTFISYPGALHAFTNPNATALGEKFKLPIAYNAAADTASWKEMQSLFQTSLK